LPSFRYNLRALTFALLIFCNNVFGVHSPGAWLAWFGSHYVKKNVFLHTELQYRSFHFPSDIEQVLLRTGLGVDLLSGKGHVLSGFCFVYGEPYAADGTRYISREYRPFQQVFFKHQQGRCIFFHRFRLEQRFNQSSYSNRLRYFFSVNCLINQKSFDKQALYLSVYNELFIQSRKTSVFDRNRIYAGVGWVPIKGLRFEFGYMSQILSSSRRNQFMLLLFQQLNFNRN